ncbi:putative thiamine biosynthetic bifunctional enzyme [Chytridium lagenaria]|nr:putative thiamine biosynthetic bifunctional enzyme [Chytridium lagenaria]
MSDKHLDLTLYLVTDQGLLPEGVSLEESVKAAIEGGVTIHRAKIKAICVAAGVLFLINDRIDVALAVNADGIHIGQEDISVADARKLVGPSRVIGVTVETVDQAIAAIKAGADYIGTSAVFATQTKIHTRGVVPMGPIGVAKILEEASRISSIPVITIGGIKENNVTQLLAEVTAAANGKKLSGIAVVSAIIAQKDAKAAAKNLRAIVEPLIEKPLPQIPSQLTRDPSLVHNITNYVVMNDNANVILHLGGSPLMAHAPEEMEDLLNIDSSLVINIGTLSEGWIAGMHKAAEQANLKNKPIVLDPVGAGATKYRMKTVVDLLTKHKISIVKGNAGEIGSIFGSDAVKSRGVDSEGDLSNATVVAKELALRLGTTIAISGKTDYVSDGKIIVTCENGNEWLGRITGTGCCTTALVGCFIAVEADPVVAAVGGILVMGIAAQKKAVDERYGGLKVNGPASFKTALFDAIYNLDENDLLKLARIDVSA